MHRKEPCIRGITPSTYDPDRDSRGDLGHALADAIYGRGPLANHQALFPYDIARVAQIALNPLPRHPQREVLLARLHDLGQEGYPVQYDASCPRPELVSYLVRVQKEIREQAQLFRPEVLAEIVRNSSPRY